ncbi:unnamed protein product, partial [marine sediment metagenome]
LRPNPGIYLPLQGGTMSGNIDMAKNRLLKLPAPTDDQEPATKAYADTFIKFIWKDWSSTALSIFNQVNTIAWTDLQLDIYTSPAAKAAILLLELHIDIVGTGNYSWLGVRKNGTSPTRRPLLQLDKAGCTAGNNHYEQVIVGLDTEQLIEYYLYVGTNWQLDVRISVLGYIE